MAKQEFTLKNRPRQSDEYNVWTERWFKHFEAKQREIYNNPEEWLDNNLPKKGFEVWTSEDIIRTFIEKEILGEKVG